MPAQGGGYCYGGPHPAPGGGWEATTSPHMHDYAPFDTAALLVPPGLLLLHRRPA